MLFPHLETPAPLVDLDRMERNLDRVAEYTARHRIALRPHIKTHKSPLIASMQLKRGATGVTCATPREAEAMSEVCEDILVAFPPVGAPRSRRLLALPPRARLTVALDSAEAIEQLATAAEHTGRRPRVLVEADLGMHRVGVPTTADVVALARLVSERRSLEYAGLAFYPGHVREPMTDGGPAVTELSARIDAFVSALHDAGLPPATVSGGSTPTLFGSHLLSGITEIRPGTYVFNDRSTAEVGACGWDDCALTVLATVVSTAVPGQAVVDAGTKALGREPLRVTGGHGFGVLLERPEVYVRAMSEEHGILELHGSEWSPKIGEQVRIIPNHVCIVVHLNDVVYGVRGERVEMTWPVAARGR